MKTIDVQPVIMCGGSGTRLWPLSRAGFPKQFLVLSGNQSLFQQATERITKLVDSNLVVAPPLIVGNEEHRFLMLDQLREIRQQPQAVLLEPVGRNTAPAMTLAALAALEQGQDPVLVVTPADQTVTDAAAFTAALTQAIREAADGAFVILGITPDGPETGYGYIKSAATAGRETPSVSCFVEKPDLDTARRYLAESGYYWNSGMFVVKASAWMTALERFRPDIAEATRKAWQARAADASFIRPGKDAFAAIPSESVDYAVLEHCPGSGIDIRMVPLAAGWSDLGAWDAVWQVAAKDGQGNAGVGDAMIENSRNTLVYATSRLVSAVGLDNVVVVETPDAVLVTDRAHSQEVKKIVAALEAQKREEHVLHRKVHRPWGWYDSMDYGHRFKVKRICVKPKASLSLQMHHHRAEHWIVVSGTAEVVCGDKTLLLSENQSTYIPLGEAHRLSNPGTIPLEIIEVQSGSYLGEDDIVRFDDTYGRTGTADKVAKSEWAGQLPGRPFDLNTSTMSQSMAPTPQAKIFVAGHRGMVGSAILRRLQRGGYSNLLTRSRQQLDLLDQRAVFDFLAAEKPDYIFLAAARVGGIQANNTYRADFIYENLTVQNNVIHGALKAGVQDLCFLGSSCIYPRDCPQPIKEEYLLTGPLEPTNEPYAIAKIAGIKLCENSNRQYGTRYVSVMPTNLYGPNDNYDLANSHVLPALIRKAHEAKLRGDSEYVVWGSGRPMREFLYVDDMADACVFLMEQGIASGLYNIGTGTDVTIRELAGTVMEVVGFEGEIVFDSSKPDGTPRKLLDVSAMAQLGWTAHTPLQEGIALAYAAYLSTLN